MFRKLTLALGATAVIAAAALTPTAASAKWFHHGHHGHWGHGHGFGFGIYAPTYIAGPDCYIVKRVVATPYGPKVRRVTVCN